MSGNFEIDTNLRVGSGLLDIFMFLKERYKDIEFMGWLKIGHPVIKLKGIRYAIPNVLIKRKILLRVVMTEVIVPESKVELFKRLSGA